MYLYLKALHIVAVVAWFAGLFYIVRLFIYLTECAQRPEPERTALLTQLQLMSRRLWFGITWPSAIATAVFGFSMLHVWLDQPWMHLKLAGVVGLYGYHLVCHWLQRELAAERFPWTSNQLRVFNEVATLFLVGIVFLVVLKDTFSFVYGLVGLVLFAGALMAGIVAYRRARASAGTTG